MVHMAKDVLRLFVAFLDIVQMGLHDIQVSKHNLECDLLLYILHLSRMFQGKDLDIYCLCMLND